MLVNLITNNLIDLYAISWCVYFIINSIRLKHHRFIVMWSSAQIILFIFDMIIRFVNKGFCLFADCEPTKTLSAFFDGIVADDKTVVVRFISMSLMFIAIMIQHNFIEDRLEKHNK
jgi:hypothetical protein